MQSIRHAVFNVASKMNRACYSSVRFPHTSRTKRTQEIVPNADYGLTDEFDSVFNTVASAAAKTETRSAYLKLEKQLDDRVFFDDPAAHNFAFHLHKTENIRNQIQNGKDTRYGTGLAEFLMFWVGQFDTEDFECTYMPEKTVLPHTRIKHNLSMGNRIVLLVVVQDVDNCRVDNQIVDLVRFTTKNATDNVTVQVVRLTDYHLGISKFEINAATNGIDVQHSEENDGQGLNLFIESDRKQAFLLIQSLKNWLQE